MTQTQAPRLLWIDALKGLGIILVVCVHHPAVWAYSEALGRAIFSFNMPLFFFVTGLTLAHGMSVNALAVRAMSSVIPYFFISLASVPIIFYLHPEMTVTDLALGVLYGTGHTIFTVPLWFLPCLGLTLVLVFLLDKIELRVAGATRSQRVITQLALFAALQLAWQLVISSDYQLARQIGWGELLTTGAPWSADVALVGASYVIMGRLFTRYIAKTEWMKETQWHSALLLGAIFIALNLLFEPAVDLNWRYDGPAVLSPLTAIAGILATVAIAASIRNSKVMALLRWFGTTTIVILWFHATLEKGAFKLLLPYLGSFSALIVSLVLALLIPAFIATVWQRFPLLYTFIAPNPWLKKVLPDKRTSRSAIPQVRTE